MAEDIDGLRHEMFQSISIIHYCCLNIRAQLNGKLSAEDSAYLMEKLDRMERQVARLMTMTRSIGPDPSRGGTETSRVAQD